MIRINAMGEACPLPVVKTLRALQSLGGAGSVETLVDNETAVQNLRRLAESKGCTVQTEQLSEKQYQVTITVGEGAELPEVGELLYHGSGAAPVYLIANESDIMPNTQVTVTAADGTAVIYQPFLSLRDGSLAVPEDGTVYDFTVYPEGFVRETTA